MNICLPPNLALKSKQYGILYFLSYKKTTKQSQQTMAQLKFA